MTRITRLLGVAWCLVGCGGAPAEPATPAPPRDGPPNPAPTVRELPAPEPELPHFPARALAPIVHSEIHQAQVVAAEQTGDVQTFEVPWPVALHPEGAGGIPRIYLSEPRAHVRLASEHGPQPHSFVLWLQPDAQPAQPTLWVRRRVTPETANEPVAIDVYVDAELGRAPAGPGRHYRLSLPAPGKLGSDGKLVQRYLTSLARRYPDTPFEWLLTPLSKDEMPGVEHRRPSTEWSQLVFFSTGYDSVEGALLWNASLRASARPSRAKIPIATLRAPQIDSHPWERMLAAVPGPTPDEPLSRAVPADFYYVRARSFDGLQALLDETDRFITPALHAFDRHRLQHQVAERYRLQLGLTSDGLSRLLGPALVNSLALVGSDPFLRQGSDVTLLIDTKDEPGLRSALGLKRARLLGAGLTGTSFEHAGVSIERHVSADGVSVNQYTASLKLPDGKQSLVLISNSRNALTRVIDTAQGKRPRLQDELDFHYMLRRDRAEPEDVLVFFGDAFVRSSVSPEQRIQDARRQLAKAELTRVGYAALMHTWIHGRSPRDVKDLVASNPWFTANDLRHTTQEPIGFEIGSAPKSTFGTPAHLTPLLDLPVPTRVTPEEKAAYETFTNFYQWRWSKHIDPIAVRGRVRSGTDGTELDLFVRVLPVMNSSELQEVGVMAGTTSVDRSALLPGIAGTLAIGTTSPLRRELLGRSRSLLGGRATLDWLGEWVALGIEDRNELALTLARSQFAPGFPSDTEESDSALLQGVPAYLALDVKSRGGAGIALTALRQLARDAISDSVQWGELEKHAGVPIIKVQFDDIVFHYALTQRRLFFAFDASLIKRLIDADAAPTAAGANPAPTKRSDLPEGAGGQFLLEWRPKEHAAEHTKQRGSALTRVVSWLAEHELSGTRAPFLPQLLLAGAPETAGDEAAQRRLALAYFGAFPVTPDERAYTWGETGLIDPVRGSAYAPIWPELPVPGGPLERVLSVLRHARSELALDTEPGAVDERSLRTRVRVQLRPRERGAKP